MANADTPIPKFKTYAEGEPIPPVDPEDLRRRWKIPLKLAREVGSGNPEHYLIPFREQKGLYDPTRPGFWPKTAFNQMCGASGVDIRP
jgi:hypothetical protein